MNQSIPLLIGLIGAGAVGAITATLLQPSTAPTATEPGAIERTATADTSIADLSKEVKRLTQRLEALESMPGTNSRAPAIDVPLAIDNSALEEAVAAALADSSTGKGGVQNLVASTLSEIRAQEEADAEAAREQRRLDGLQRYIDRLETDLELYGDQPTQVFNILNDESARRDELRDLMRDGQATFEDMTALRDETKAALTNVLTQSQMEKYEETNRFRGFGGGNGGGRGGNGGGPGGGGGL